MAHFLGEVSGSRGKASRLGTKKSGLKTTAASWAGAITVDLDFNELTGKSTFSVWQREWRGKGINGSEPLAEGIIGEPVKKEDGPRDRRAELASIADKLAEVRDWCEIPEEVAAGINGVLDELNNIIDVCANCGHTEADHDREHGNKASCGAFSFVPFVPKKAEG